MYVVWIKIDETLPWIELKGEYQTRIDARKVAKSILNTARIKIAKTRTKAKPMKVAATVNR